MTEFTWSRPALADYRSILDWIGAENPYAAKRVADAIRERLVLLATMQRMGRAGRVEGTRELVVSDTPYIVVYELSGDGPEILILRILHGTRKWPPK